MLNEPPYLPVILPTAEGDAEERMTGSMHTYDADSPPQRLGQRGTHRFLVSYDIGVWVNGNRGGQLTPGLGQNQVVTYDVDQSPEFWVVVMDSEAGASAAMRVYLGIGVGGPFFRLGSKGKLKVPAQGQNYITLQNLGAGVAFGTVVAAAGFPSFELDYAG